MSQDKPFSSLTWKEKLGLPFFILGVVYIAIRMKIQKGWAP